MAKTKEPEAPATGKVKYIGDGGTYVLGVPADPDIEQEFDAERAHALVATGLYEFVGEAPPAPEPDPAPEPEQPAEPTPTEADGSDKEVSE
jgi:hypothetical protein